MNAYTNGHTPHMHDLLNASVEKIAQEWVEQLNELRENATALESQLMACVAQTKASINKLHELGQQVAEEAQRGKDVIAKVTGALDEINPPAA